MYHYKPGVTLVNPMTLALLACTVLSVLLLLNMKTIQFCCGLNTCIYGQAVHKVSVSQHRPSEKDVLCVQPVGLAPPPKLPLERVEIAIGLLTKHNT